MTDLDIRALRTALQLQAGSPASITLTAVDSAGDPVDVTGVAMTIAAGGSTITATTTDPQAGRRVFALSSANTTAVQTAGGGTWKFRDASTGDWVTGTCVASTDGTPGQSSSVDVTVGSASVELTINAAVGVTTLPDIEEGDAGKALVVNAEEDGVEWGTVEGGVTSVNSETGAVVLTAADVGADPAGTAAAAVAEVREARTVEAPADNSDSPPIDGTVTTLTATDGVLDVDVVVCEDSAEGDRPAIVTPPLAEWPNQFLTIVGQSLGASFGYPTGAHPGVFGDLATIFGGAPTLTYQSANVTLTFTIDGEARQVLLDQDYSDANALLQAIIAQLSTWADVQFPYTDVVGGRTLQAALVSKTTGADSEVVLTDAGEGDPTGLGELTSTAGVDEWYLGYQNDSKGTGELNGESNGNHTFFDAEGQAGKWLVVFNDGTRLYNAPPMRAEFVHYAVGTASGGPTDSQTTVLGAIDALNDAVKAIQDQLA